MRLLLAVFLTVFSILASSCSNSGSSAPAAKNGSDPSEFSGLPGDCKQFIASLPADYFHDWTAVPENPFEESSPKITVFYYGPKKLNDDVVIFYNGGPGSDSHGNHTSLQKEINRYNLQNKISIVYMDQRGTGCSAAYPTQKTATDILRARWYGSTGIVYDSEAVRQKLIGDKKWKIFGQSYGAFIVHRYVSLFPNSVKAAYAHANTISSDPLERLYGRILSQHRTLQMYFANYPQDQEKLKFLKGYLSENVCFETTYIGLVCGHEAIEGLIPDLGFSNRWPSLNKSLNLAVTKNADGSLAVNSNALKDLISENDYEEAPTGYSLSTIGYFDRNVAAIDFETCTQIYNKLSVQGINSDVLLMTECLSAIQFHANSKSREIVKSALGGQTDILTLEKFKNGLMTMGSKNFYLYSGEKDTFVPKDNFTEEINALGSMINYTHFTTSGHEGYRTEKQVWDDLSK